MSLRCLLNLQRKVLKLPFTGYVLRSVTQLSNTKFENTAAENVKERQDLSRTDFTDDMPVPDIQNPFEREKPKCILCKYEIKPDYKNVRLLSQFVSPYTGRIYGRHITALCKAKQASVEKEIVKSQNCGLMPYYFKKPSFLKDPKLYDADNPLRPHRF